MIFGLCMLLINSFVGGPTMVLSWLAYFAMCMPFFADMIISVQGAYKKLTGEQEMTSSATVEEIPSNRDTLIENDQPETMREETKEDYFDPSDRLVPEALAENT